MPHVITLPDELFVKLQAHAVPLVDTPLTIIERALAALEAGDEDASSSAHSAQSFNPGAAPNLAHTTPRKAIVAGKMLKASATYWNPVMFAVIREAAARGVSTDDLMNLITVNCVLGEKSDHGYRFIGEAGISVQGQDANAAWKQTYRVASSLGIDVVIEFVWQDNEKAAMPNTLGSFYVGGK